MREIKDIMYELSLIDEISTNANISTRKSEKTKKKYRKKAVNKTPPIKEKLKHKIQSHREEDDITNVISFCNKITYSKLTSRRHRGKLETQI